MQQVVFHLLGPPDIFCRRRGWIDPPVGKIDRPVDSLDQPVPIKIPRRRSRALLYYMVSTHTPQPRERLLNLLCGEMDEEGARHAFKTMLAEVRAHLRAIDASIDWIISDGDHLSFNPLAPIWLDTEIFEKDAVVTSRNVSHALTLYRGDFLDGFFLKDSPDFESWVQSTRDHFRHLYLSALRHLTEMYEADHQLDEAISCIHMFLAADPLSEEAHTYLMRLFWQAGDRIGALREYEKLSVLLMKEFSVQPSASTQALYQQIAQPYGANDAQPRGTEESPQHLRHTFGRGTIYWPEADGSKNAGASPGGPPAFLLPPNVGTRFIASGGRLIDRQAGYIHQDPMVSPREQGTKLPFVGREKEMAWVRSHLMDAENAVPFLLISGEMGSGKTRLLHEVIRAMGADWSIAQGRCRGAEQKNRYHIVAEILRAECLRERVAQIVLPEVWRAQLIGLVPDLFAGENVGPIVLEPAVLADALVALLSALASLQRPLLLIFDDLHWADEDTFALLAHCVHAFQDKPIFLLGTCVPGIADTRAVGRLINRKWLQQDNEWNTLELPPLTAADIETITRSVFPDFTLQRELPQSYPSDWWYLQSEGNPFLAVEWLFAWKEQVKNGHRLALERIPESIEHKIQIQLRLLDREACALLSAMAYLGRSFRLMQAAELLQFNRYTTLTASEELIRRRLIVEAASAHPDDYVFVHHVVREVVLAAMSSAQRSVFQNALSS